MNKKNPFYQTVLYPIQVPPGKFCWGHLPPYKICTYFDNEGGYSTCTLGFDIGKNTKDGVLKAAKCLNFKIEKEG